MRKLCAEICLGFYCLFVSRKFGVYVFLLLVLLYISCCCYFKRLKSQNNSFFGFHLLSSLTGCKKSRVTYFSQSEQTYCFQPIGRKLMHFSALGIRSKFPVRVQNLIGLEVDLQMLSLTCFVFGFTTDDALIMQQQKTMKNNMNSPKTVHCFSHF